MDLHEPTAEPGQGDFIRLLGLYRRWELEHLAEQDTELYVEPAGSATDGTCLLSVYRRARRKDQPR